MPNESSSSISNNVTILSNSSLQDESGLTPISKGCDVISAEQWTMTR